MARQFPEFHVRGFLDESGQMEKPFGRKAVGLILQPRMPDDRSADDRLAFVVGPLRERIAREFPDQRSPKGSQWRNEDVARLARQVRYGRWQIRLPTLDTRPQSWHDEWAGQDAEARLRDGFESTELSVHVSVEFKERFIALFMKFPAYVNIVYPTIRDFGQHMLYVKKHWINTFDLTVDARFPVELLESLRQLVCLAFKFSFSHLAFDGFRDAGAPPTVTLNAINAATSDGMVIADALAYWTGQIYRGRDSDGTLQMYFDALNIEKPLPQPIRDLM